MNFIVLDTKFIDRHVIDSYKSVIWTDRYSSWGDFELYLAPSIENLSFLQKEFYLWSGDSEHTMIIEDVRITSDLEEGNHLIVTGRSLESLLERRIIWQQTILTGNFQEGIKRLISESITNPTDKTRLIPNFIFKDSTDPIITSLKLDSQFTGTNLYEAIKKLCDPLHIGFKVTLSEDNKFIFELYVGTDRSYDQIANPYVIFSPNFDNLINSNYYTSVRGFKTITLVAGEGEGLERVTVEVPIKDGSGSGINRREMYTDARDLSTNNGEISAEVYLDMLRQRGMDYLSANSMAEAFEGSADTLHKYIYGRDFFMGDIVQLENEYGIESTCRVIELVSSANEEGFSKYPTFAIDSPEYSGSGSSGGGSGGGSASNLSLDILMNYTKAQFSMSGGGLVVWTGTHLRWSQRFLFMPINKSIVTDGYIGSGVYGENVVIPGLNGTPDVVTTIDGVPLPPSSALIIRHNIGGRYSERTLYIVYLELLKDDLRINDLIIAVHNPDFNTIKLGDGRTIPPTIWITPTFLNNWRAYSAPGTTWAPRYMREPDDTVVIGGLLAKDSAPQAGIAIFTLPQYYRPQFSEMFTEGLLGTDAVMKYVPMQVGSNGDVSLNSISGLTSTANVSWMAITARFKAFS